MLKHFTGSVTFILHRWGGRISISNLWSLKVKMIGCSVQCFRLVGMTMLGNSGSPHPQPFGVPRRHIGRVSAEIWGKGLTIPDLEFSTWELWIHLRLEPSPNVKKTWTRSSHSLSREGSEGLCCGLASLAPLSRSPEPWRHVNEAVSECCCQGA